ncbi:Anti-repressor SinI [Halobacillus dabanensis]|uniref:Anti-repressor SinI n=1 Tax=Halobacillus dabanensis TaxID=240302 RepID=A0A1I3XDD7_HALDA|nr:anti-repressor SinI family protein [Halobacillus dabanensis]SFK17558.1 Anti-repressor SinI [Halobacillus dabanensis]
MAVNEEMDKEWIDLMKEAKDLGLTISEIYDFFAHKQIPELYIMKE